MSELNQENRSALNDGFFAEGAGPHQMTPWKADDEFGDKRNLIAANSSIRRDFETLNRELTKPIDPAVLRFVTKHNSDRAKALIDERLPGLNQTARDEKTERLAKLFDLGWDKAVPVEGKRKRGRPITAQGAIRRELGMSRLGQWKSLKMAEIPEDQFEELLKKSGDIAKKTGRGLGTNGILRLAGKLSPEKPRPHVRSAANAIIRLTRAKQRLEELYRRMREVASDEELQLLSDARTQVDLALEALVGSSAQAVAILDRIEPTAIQEFLEADSTAE
jgi:hypothetical protein